jgi:outer membrane protein, multidrug efflux system
VRWRLLLLAPLLTGCLVGPNYSCPEVCPQEKWEARHPEHFSSETADYAKWWTVFDDPTLNKLIYLAIENNWDLESARNRIVEARYLRRIVRGDLYPQIDVAAGAARLKDAPNATGGTFFLGDPDFTSNSFELGFDASWELDVFGRIRRGIEAETYNIESEIGNWRDTIVTLLGDVGRAYIELRGSQKRLDVIRSNITLQEEAVEITELRFDAGLTSYLDVAQAKRVLEATYAEAPTVHADEQQAIFRLGVLIGANPTELMAELFERKEIPLVPPKLPVGIPSDVLLRRPDIHRAERDLAEANARVGVAVAERFPRFNLLAALGLQARSLPDLFQRASQTWFTAGEVLLPLFRAGSLVAAVDAQKARRARAYAIFQQTVLLALEEVEAALVRFTEEQRRYGSLAMAREHAQSSVDLSLELYRSGLIDFLTVLDAQRALFIIEDDLAVSEALITGFAISVYKALGGGWEEVCLSYEIYD